MSEPESQSPPKPQTGDVSTLRYMARFRCIGGDCEDTCCYGWRVEVDAESFERLERATADQPDERRRLEATFKPRKRGGRTASGRPARYVIPLSVDDLCPMLEPDGACHLHRVFGEDLLPGICATYPRRLNAIGGRLELHGALSCPEIVRQLMVDDAMEPATIERERIPSQVPPRRVPTRDVRPLWRTQVPVRRLVIELLTLAGRPLESRLFYLAWLAHRTTSVLARDVVSSDDAALAREMALVRDPDVLDELDQRLARLDTPASAALIVARLIVDLPRDASRTWSTYMQLVDSVLETYGGLRPLWQMKQLGATSPELLDARPVWRAYLKRRGRIRERLGNRVDELLARIAQHYFHMRPNREAPDLLAHVLRLLGELAAIKLLLYSHPRLTAAELDRMGDDEARSALDEVSVEVVYKVARFVEHSKMLDHLEELLDDRGMRSLAGAVYLIRF